MANGESLFCVRLPPDATSSTVISSLAWLLTTRCWLSGLSTPTLESVPRAKVNGEPAMGLKAPSGAMVNTATVVPTAVALGSKRRLDLQLMSTSFAMPKSPAAKGELDTAVSLPSEPILNMATESEFARATPRTFPLGETFMPSGVPPAGTEPIGTSAPFEAILKAEMFPEPPFPAYRNRPLGVAANEMPKSSADPPLPNGESGTGVNPPLSVSILKALMSLL